MKASKNTPQPGWGTSELVGIMVDRYRQEVTLDGVRKVTEAALKFVELQKTLCELSGLHPREVGVFESVASVDRLMALTEKLESGL